ncbi:hypothetical protein HDU86_003180 [Geranomyces michiganensis]|nr:hypothetical protein HDU86_003180 [Geranomyces michiganensis]
MHSRPTPRGPAWTKGWTAGTADFLISRGRELYGAPAVRGRDWEAVGAVLADVWTDKTDPQSAADFVRTLLRECEYRPWRIVAGSRPPGVADVDPSVRAHLWLNRPAVQDTSRKSTSPLSSIYAASDSGSMTSFECNDSNSGSEDVSASDSQTRSPDSDQGYDEAADETILLNYHPHLDRNLALLPPARLNALYSEEILTLYKIDKSLVWELATPFTTPHLRAILARYRRDSYVEML